MAELAAPFPVLLDKRGPVRARYGLAALPTTYIVDSLGAVHAGPLTRRALEQRLTLILHSAGPFD